MMKTRQNTLRLMCVWPGISLDSNAVCLVYIVSVVANAENLETERGNLKKYEKRMNANAEQQEKKTNDN